MIKKVIGMGNALTDILININNDEVLKTFGLPRGSMNLVDSELQRRISKEVADMPRTLSIGGSASNTIRAMAKLGNSTGYIGKVGHDNTGDFFEKAMINLGIQPFIFRGQARSGRCVSLVSTDGERTMCTFLGAAIEMSHKDLNSSIFTGYDCLYIEGYLVQDHNLIREAVKMAKNVGLKVAIDLASFNIVEENLQFLRTLANDYIDIIFANEQEAASFSGLNDPLKALDMISEMCELAVIKVGMRGAYIKHAGSVIHTDIMAAAKRIDTTGAGDFYAAGFLSGICHGFDLRQCGTLGAVTAGKVIEVVGTTFGEESWRDILITSKEIERGNYLL